MDDGQETNDERAAYYAELFSDVTHDLRAPLGVILGAVGELEGGGDLDPEQRTLVSLVRRSATRLSFYATNLLELSRFDTGCLQLRRLEVDLVDIVREAVTQAHRVEEGHSVSVEVAVPESNLAVRLDPDRVGLAVSNLVIRALRVARERVGVRLENEEGGARLEVVDDGARMGAQERGRLFEHEQRVMGEGGRRDVGLTVAGLLVRAHGGRIRAEDVERGGLRVVVDLPGAPPAGTG